MKPVMMPLLVLALGGALEGQDDPRLQSTPPVRDPQTRGRDAAKNEVEAPVREAKAVGSEGKYDLARTGIEWHRGMDEVQGKDKPILLLQLLGNYDDVYC